MSSPLTDRLGPLTPLAERSMRFLKAEASSAAGFSPHAAVVFVACIGVYLLKKIGFLSGWGLAPTFALAVIVGSLAFIKSSDVARPLLIVQRTIFLLFAFYAVISYPAVSDVYIYESWRSEFLHLHVRWLAPAVAVLAWFRPGFGIVPVALMAWKKHLMAAQFGFKLNATDYYPVAELALYTTLAIGFAAAGAIILKRKELPQPFKPNEGWSLGEAAFLGAFGIHIANYFYSAVAKVTLPGASLLTWVLENETHNIMMATWVIGLGPLQSFEWMGFAGHEFMARFQHGSNALVFASQVAGLFCIIRLRWAQLLTGFYDIMHLVIFVTTSILFWKWMTLNAGLVLALGWLIKRKEIPRPLVVMTMGVTLLAPTVFWVATLGWFDTAALNKATVEAITEDGRSVELPNVYFLEGSAQVSKSSIGSPFDGHFDISVFGKAKGGREQMHRAKTCDLPVAEESGLANSFTREPRLETYFKQHHAYVQTRLNKEGRFNAWVFPHHNWANPSRYRDYQTLDLRQVTAYRYIIESVCLSYDGEGGVTEDVRLRGTYVIDVD
ncbi:hypothetical protein HK107_10990 [Parvularcula sp. ZS-1/3]|uniref:DUF4153 domain-containing protein n=1 Tax=Parvularcula mediterranea TaxID=2732508 RepID=A0A7Y3RMI8_9PROT|nr:hypothetical protein [Parvularcula mediterranea]NNU16843.1 hypothetical protein [Parvularcula mediterranea]